MLNIREPTTARAIADPDVCRLVEQRFAEICDGERYDYDIHGEIIVVEPGNGDSIRFPAMARRAKHRKK